MKKTLPLLVTLAALGMGATMAQARSPERPALPTFEQLDADQSGSVTMAEVQAHFQAQMQGRKDQAVSKLMERAGDDGVLDESELRAGLEAMGADARERMGERGERGKGQGDRAERGEHGQRGKGHGDRGDRAERGERGQMGERMFSRIDANSDGALDAEEYAAFTAKVAERMQQRGQ